MDDTIIRVKSGAKFAKNATDWIFWHESVPKKMQELEKDGFKIVIFTNQLGVSTGKSNINDLKKKIQDISKEMKI
jgi:bifunctional polynucleotide phosphatase/kinase